jgi:hypothetical protein
MDIQREFLVTLGALSKQVAGMVMREKATTIVIRALTFATQNNPKFVEYLTQGPAQRDLEFVRTGLNAEELERIEKALKELLPDQFHPHVLSSLTDSKPTG